MWLPIAYYTLRDKIFQKSCFNINSADSEEMQQ